MDLPVPQFMGADVEIMRATPQERMQTRTLEQIAAFPVPQISEERVVNRTPEQIMDFAVSQNMEAYAGIVLDTPLERVTTEEIVEVMQVKKGPKRVFVDLCSSGLGSRRKLSSGYSAVMHCSGQGVDLPVIVQVQEMVEYMEVPELQFIDEWWLLQLLLRQGSQCKLWRRPEIPWCSSGWSSTCTLLCK